MFDAPVVSIHIPPGLRGYAGGHAEITASGDTVGELFAALGREYPAISARLVAGDGGLLPGLTVYLGGRSVGELQGLATPVGLEEVISIVATGPH